MSDYRKQRIYRSIPDYYQPGVNRMITAILDASANENGLIDQAIINAKEQLFVKLAQGQFLDQLASNLGVSRFTIIYFADSVFRQLIPLLSFAPKQVRESIYKVLELFWSTSYLHSTVTSTSVETYNLSGGEKLTLVVDEKHEVEVAFLADNFETPGAATAQEVVDRINAWLPEYITAFVDYDPTTEDTSVSIATKTFGLAGAIQVTGGTANSILNFPTKKVQYTKVSLHEINPNELVLRIPREIPVGADGLKWAHRFHADATIVDGRPNITAATPYWPGHFFYDRPNGSSPGVSSTRAILQQTVTAGLNYAILVFDDVSDFPSLPTSTQRLVFNYGLSNQEEPVRYLQRISNTQLRIDATYSFLQSHAIGDIVNLGSPTPVVPTVDGLDYPIFFIDTEIATTLVQQAILLLKAAGIIVRIVTVD